MPSAAFLHRMETVLSTRVEAKIDRETPRFLWLRRAASAIGATLVCLMVLKGAGLAHDATAFRASPPPEASYGALLAHWLIGADPISSALAAAMRPGGPSTRPDTASSVVE